MNSNRGRSKIGSNFIKTIITRLSKLILKNIFNKVNNFKISDI